MKPLIWAHRGARTCAPENTLEAFERAIAQKSDGIELDVHLSGDGQLVVAHDETVDRMSDGRGRIVDKTLAELRALDFSKGFGSFSPTRIPTLREVYDLIRPTSLTVNVEIKTGLVLYPGIEQKLVSLAGEMHMSDRVLYSSFNHYSLLSLRAIDPPARIGLLYTEALVDPHLYALHLKADAIHPFYPTLQAPGVLEGCRAHGIGVHPWTVNDPDMIRQLIRMGVQAIITDYPERARTILEEESL